MSVISSPDPVVSASLEYAHLDDAQLSSRNIKGVNIRRQSSESLLRTVRSDESVDLHTIHIVELLQSLLDLSLVRLDIHNEYQCVVLLDLLHRRLSVERVNDHLVVVESGNMRNGLAWVFRSTAKDESLWSVEGCGCADLAGFLRVDLTLV